MNRLRYNKDFTYDMIIYNAERDKLQNIYDDLGKQQIDCKDKLITLVKDLIVKHNILQESDWNYIRFIYDSFFEKQHITTSLIFKNTYDDISFLPPLPSTMYPIRVDIEKGVYLLFISYNETYCCVDMELISKLKSLMKISNYESVMSNIERKINRHQEKLNKYKKLKKLMGVKEL